MAVECPRQGRARAATGIFIFGFLSTLALINLAYFNVLSFNSRQGLANAWFEEVVAFLFAYDLAELLLVSVMNNRDLSRRCELLPSPRVALVCCTCDDVDPDALAALAGQTYSNLRVFVLDDSQGECARELVDRSPFTVVRRGHRRGFKAGNLNNWLALYGDGFDYVAVADADSILPPPFVTEMVAYLEHPSNEHVGNLESCIRPWNDTNPFARLLGVNAIMNRLVSLRVASHLGATFSVGHNNVIRIRALRDVGGFDERYLAEDYALAIALMRTGFWSSETADVTSFERVPENANEYARRQARWAFQTFQLLKIDTSRLPWAASMRLVRTIAYYFEPLLLLVALTALTVWSAWHVELRLPSWAADGYDHAFMPPRLLALGAMMLLPVAARMAIMRQHQVTAGVAFRSMLLNAALVCTVAWPVARRLITEGCGRRLGFDVTGRSEVPTFGRILLMGAPVYVASWVVLITTFVGPVTAYWNMLWAVPGALAPWLIWRYQECLSPTQRV